MNKIENKIERSFLAILTAEQRQVTLFLVNGVKLVGKIAAFDTATVALKRDNHVQLVYRHAISTVMPMEPIEIYFAREPSASATMGDNGHDEA